MNNFENNKIQQAALKWLEAQDWGRPFAVTVTFKQGNGKGLFLDRYRASQNVVHFENVLDGKFFSTRERKKGHCLKTFAVSEVSLDGRIHYHLIIDCPRDQSQLSDQWFAHIVEHWWRKTNWGYHIVDVKPCDSGWGNYILKFKTKPDYDLDIDWEAVRKFT